MQMTQKRRLNFIRLTNTQNRHLHDNLGLKLCDFGTCLA